MRFVIISFAALLLATGCTPSGRLLEEEGKIKSPGGNWTVELLSVEPGLIVSDRHARELWPRSGIRLTSKKVTPDDWKNFPGAFVYFDGEDRVWAYNGEDRTFIYERRPESDTAWTITTWPHPIPEEVRARLPDSLTEQNGLNKSAQVIP